MQARQSRRWLGLAVVGVLIGGCSSAPHQTVNMTAGRSVAPQPQERHFAALRMLTDGGENAEAYFSFSGKQLIFQSTRPPYGCDQIMKMGIDGSRQTLVSTGKGRTTCAYFMPGDRRVLYASTHRGSEQCPPPPDMSRGYVWSIDPNYDIYTANVDGTALSRLTDLPGYDAEATVSPIGDRIVFTSTRDGDLDLYSMNLDGSNVVRLTEELGYDGGAFYSPDGRQIVYRAMHPQAPDAIEDYKQLLANHLVRPSRLELWVMDADGRNKRQLTSLGVASFAPYFHPSGKKVIFASNHPDVRSREFDLWMINLDGTGLEQITHSAGFDGFPMFSPDGKQLVFCSNRNNSKPGETNVFLADWVD